MVYDDDRFLETETELYEHAPCGYVSILPDGLIVKINRTFLSWLGMEREQLVGKKRFRELLTIPGQIFFENHFHPILLMQSRVNEVALDFKVPGGQPLPTLITGTLKRDESGAPMVIRLTVFNATERRAYEQALLNKTKELNRLNARKNELLGMAAHDLRTPLGAISTYSNLLASEIGQSLSPIHREFLDTILDMSAFMSDLITDILDVASIESGSLRLDQKPQTIEPILRRAVSINGVLARKKGIKIENDVDETETFCLVDHRKIDQVLNNLLGNAIKYSHSGSTIHVSMKIDGEDVTIAIRDEGQGIPADELEKIFTPFKQGSVRSTAGEPSTGLGLAIVRSIVMGHGGKIWVTSEVGEGSTFFFTVKRSDANETSKEKEIPAQKGNGSNIPDAPRVLVVEDNAINQRIISMMLGKLGTEIMVATNGQDALALFEKTEIDVILMDCQMPVMDGYEATAAIRRLEQTNGRIRTPIIALTASDADADRQRCLAAGMDDFLPKPTGFSQLEKLLERWLKRDENSPSLE